MSGFVCKPSVVPAGEPSPERVIVNDGFFPDVDPARLRLQAKIGTDVDADRLREVVLGAMLDLARELASIRLVHTLAGTAALADVTAPMLDGESSLVLLYRRALGCLVRAELIVRNRDNDMTGRAELRAEALDPTETDLRQAARYAIRDLLGRPRIVAELI